MKINLLSALLILSLFCVSAQARPKKRGAEAADDIQTALETTSEKKHKKYNAADLSKVENLYFSGKLEKAELVLNEILLTYKFVDRKSVV
mgnify:CR=1 FL=1